MPALLIKIAAAALSVYEKIEDFLCGTVNLFRLPQLANRISRHFSKHVVLLAIELFVALSLSVYFYYMVKPQYDGHFHNRVMFSYWSSHGGVKHSGKPSAWDGRILAPVISLARPAAPKRNTLPVHHRRLCLAIIRIRPDRRQQDGVRYASGEDKTRATDDGDVFSDSHLG